MRPGSLRRAGARGAEPRPATPSSTPFPTCSGRGAAEGREGDFRRDPSTHAEDMLHVRPRRQRSPFPLQPRASLALIPRPPAARSRRTLPELRPDPRDRSREILRDVHRAPARGLAEGRPQDPPAPPQPPALPRLRNGPPAAPARPLPSLQRKASRSPPPHQTEPPGGAPQGRTVPQVRQEYTCAGQHLVRRLPRGPPTGATGTHPASQARGDRLRLHRLRRRDPYPCAQALPGLPGIAAPAGKGGGSCCEGAAPGARYLHHLRQSLRGPRAEGVPGLPRCMGPRILAQQADTPGTGPVRELRQAFHSRLCQLRTLPRLSPRRMASPRRHKPRARPLRALPQTPFRWRDGHLSPVPRNRSRPGPSPLPPRDPGAPACRSLPPVRQAAAGAVHARVRAVSGQIARR